MEIVLKDGVYNSVGKLIIQPGVISTRIEIDHGSGEALAVSIENDELRMALNAIPEKRKI
jgi:hypothetical protein